MSVFLEITQLENGDIVLREAEDETPRNNEMAVRSTDGARAEPEHGSTARSRDPLVRISFSDEVRDMLGGDLVGVAEAMIDAATDYLGGETVEAEGEEAGTDLLSPAPVIH
jgi:hypothetical protein